MTTTSQEHEWLRTLRSLLDASSEKLQVESLKKRSNSAPHPGYTLELRHDFATPKAALSAVLASAPRVNHLKSWPSTELGDLWVALDGELCACVRGGKLSLVVTELDPAPKPEAHETDFHLFFLKTFGRKFALALDTPLVLLGNRIWGCPNAAHATQGVLPIAAPMVRGDWPDFTLTGLWGYGVNCWAFYYIEKKGKSLIFLRLPYGGAYGNLERDGAGVLERIEKFADFRRRYEGRTQWQQYNDDMGDLTKRVKLIGS